MILSHIEKASSLKESFYSEKDLETLDLQRIPSHVAIVMDGNRRWSEAHQVPIEAGHAKGASQLKKIVSAALELKIQTLTVFALSTENKNRSEKELNALFSLFSQYLESECAEMVSNGIVFETIGDLSGLPLDLRLLIEKVKDQTKMGKELNLVVAINYGGRNELCRAFQRIIEKHQGAFEPGFLVTPHEVSSHLDTAPFGDPELVIRTSGEYRVSNFLLWQMSYSEIYFTSAYWPDFSPQSFLKAIQSYQHREIRRGL